MSPASAALIVVCPHCHSPNRVPAERLAEGGAVATCGKCKDKLFPGEPVELDETSFATHAGRSDLPLVVDFWAPWCGPCRAMAPAFAQAARNLEPHYQLEGEHRGTAGAGGAIRHPQHSHAGHLQGWARDRTPVWRNGCGKAFGLDKKLRLSPTWRRR